MTIDSSLSFDIQSDEFAEIYEEHKQMNIIDKMMTYLDGLYFELMDKNKLGSDYHFDDSWIGDMHQFVDHDDRIIKIITHLENRDYTSAMLYVQDMLDGDQEDQLIQIESERLAELSSETIGNM